MNARYALRIETEDCSLDEPFAFIGEKRLALQVARKIAADKSKCNPLNDRRVIVDDTRTDLSVGFFEVRQ